MKLNRVIIMGLMLTAMATNVQAAVVGEVKQNIEVSEGSIIKEEGTEVTIVGINGDCYEVVTGEETLEIEKDLIKTEGVITKTTEVETKFRENPNPTADIVQYLNKDELVVIIEKYGDFYKAQVNGLEGYIYKTQIDTSNLEDVKDMTPQCAVEEAPEVVTTESKGGEIVTLARKYVGGRYVYGGNNLETGVDCSGFTQQIMKKAGISIERSSRSQYASSGTKVSVSNVQPGDLVFYGSNGVTVDHVAIYAGDGQIIHASDSKSGIKVSKLNYGKPIIGVKRVTN